MWSSGGSRYSHLQGPTGSPWDEDRHSPVLWAGAPGSWATWLVAEEVTAGTAVLCGRGTDGPRLETSHASVVSARIMNWGVGCTVDCGMAASPDSAAHVTWGLADMSCHFRV